METEGEKEVEDDVKKSKCYGYQSVRQIDIAFPLEYIFCERQNVWAYKNALVDNQRSMSDVFYIVSCPRSLLGLRRADVPSSLHVSIDEIKGHHSNNVMLRRQTIMADEGGAVAGSSSAASSDKVSALSFDIEEVGIHFLL